MPSWKKVIVSGSNAHLNQITGSNLLISNTISGTTISGSFTGDASGLTGVALADEVSGSWGGALSGSLNIISGSEQSTGSFGRLEVLTSTAQGTGSFNHVSSSTYEGRGDGLTHILPLDSFEKGVAVTSDGSATITLNNIVFVTTNAGEIVYFT
jgi:hypothetical protein